MTPDITIFAYIGKTIESTLDIFVSATSSNVITGISGLVLAGVILYFTIYGYLVMFGHIEEPLFDFLKKAGKILLIISLALGVGTYQSNIVESFRGLESGLSTMVHNGSASNIYDVLDISFCGGATLTEKALDRANEFSILNAPATVIGWFLSGLIIALATIILTVVAAGYILLAKVALSMLLGIGPIFIMCLLFPPVIRFFDAWAGQVITYILVIVLMATAMAFSLKIFDAFVGKVNFADPGQHALTIALQLLIISCCLLIIVFQIPTIAAALGGGFGLSMLNPLRGASMAARGLKNIVNPVSVRRDMGTGHMETASRMQHVRSGNTVMNPAYSRRLYENLRTGWGGWNKNQSPNKE
ncbi:MAG: Type IV secretion system protein VirB6 [Syntrophorhabdaceae bacterium PtaU1.Bin034]|nr:MAG: Type IV secretion system protein VirB6 [Syntrophorhabdaceae bacterium PtaU1.Bin034]